MIAITETWLSDNILDAEIALSGMTIIRRDRPSRGGGVALYYQETLQCEVISDPMLSMNDALCVVSVSTTMTFALLLSFIVPRTHLLRQTKPSLLDLDT